MLTCTFLSVPAYFLFWTSNKVDMVNGTYTDYIVGLSLGNLGEEVTIVNELDLSSNSQKIDLLCENGVIGKVLKNFVAQTELMDAEEVFKKDTYCELSSELTDIN